MHKISCNNFKPFFEFRLNAYTSSLRAFYSYNPILTILFLYKSTSIDFIKNYNSNKITSKEILYKNRKLINNFLKKYFASCYRDYTKNLNSTDEFSGENFWLDYYAYGDRFQRDYRKFYKILDQEDVIGNINKIRKDSVVNYLTIVLEIFIAEYSKKYLYNNEEIIQTILFSDTPFSRDYFFMNNLTNIKNMLGNFSNRPIIDNTIKILKELWFCDSADLSDMNCISNHDVKYNSFIPNFNRVVDLVNSIRFIAVITNIIEFPPVSYTKSNVINISLNKKHNARIIFLDSFYNQKTTKNDICAYEINNHQSFTDREKHYKCRFSYPSRTFTIDNIFNEISIDYINDAIDNFMMELRYYDPDKFKDLYEICRYYESGAPIIYNDWW